MKVRLWNGYLFRDCEKVYVYALDTRRIGVSRNLDTEWEKIAFDTCLSKISTFKNIGYLELPMKWYYFYKFHRLKYTVSIVSKDKIVITIIEELK